MLYAILGRRKCFLGKFQTSTEKKENTHNQHNDLKNGITKIRIAFLVLLGEQLGKDKINARRGVASLAGIHSLLFRGCICLQLHYQRMAELMTLFGTLYLLLYRTASFHPMRTGKVCSLATQAHSAEACFLGSDHCFQGDSKARLPRAQALGFSILQSVLRSGQFNLRNIAFLCPF